MSSEPSLVGPRQRTPTGGHFCARAAASRRRSAPGSRPRASSRWRPASCRSRPATRRTCTPSRPSSSGPTSAARRSTCTPRRSSPARSCWPRASASIFTFAPVFRNRERGALHAPEFTMLEWYRADAALRGGDGGLRRNPEARGRDRGQPLRLLARCDRQSARRARAAHGRASLRPLRRGRSARQHDRDGDDARRLAAMAEAAGVRRAPTIPGPIYSAEGADGADRAASSATDARRCSPNIRRAKPRWRGAPRRTHASPSASSSTAAG